MARINQCKNSLLESRCDKWIIDNYKSGDDQADYGSSMDKLNKKAEEICSECKNFKQKDSPKYFSGTQELFRKGTLVTSRHEK